MNFFHFSDAPHQRYRVQRRPGSAVVRVDDGEVALQPDSAGRFNAVLEGRSERLHAVAHGDVLHVHWRGRAWRIERADPTRGSRGDGAGGEGALLAPMPGVVVSVQAAPRQHVRVGDALLVIESMKLQMTICAERDGTVAELPLAVGQTFQRGAMLARIQAGDAQ